MHDVKAIREDPRAFDQGWVARGLPPQTPAILLLDEALRRVQTELQAAQGSRNELSRQIGQARSAGEVGRVEGLTAKVDRLKTAMARLASEETRLAGELRALLAGLPNIPDADVPAGVDESANVERRRWGEPFAIINPQDHVTLGAAGGAMDFDAAARMSGSRFVVLKGELARLERAIGQLLMLELHVQEHGYLEVSPPLLVREEAVFGSGQLPKFAADLFETTDGRWLIPTAEVSLANLAREQTLDVADLPLRFAALTPCFRSEAGASGKDTRGMIRVHQFNKVELVSVTTPEMSAEELERTTACAEAVLRRLELPFRTVELCAGDMGFSVAKTYDIEVWLPSQATWREISSCSNCRDFQARRMNARCKAAGEKGTRFVHTLNGSGLAVGRTLVAILENYQDEDGRIALPQALHPYMRGVTHILGRID